MDKFTRAKRSQIMSHVKGRDSKIEVSFRKELWKRGFRYRKNASGYFGKPDIVLKKHKTVIFIDSCFWHGCKKHGSIPAVRKSFWSNKIAQNISRDKEVTKRYKKQGWKIFRVWEHDLRNIEQAVRKINL